MWDGGGGLVPWSSVFPGYLQRTILPPSSSMHTLTECEWPGLENAPFPCNYHSFLSWPQTHIIAMTLVVPTARGAQHPKFIPCSGKEHLEKKKKRTPETLMWVDYINMWEVRQWHWIPTDVSQTTMLSLKVNTHKNMSDFCGCLETKVRVNGDK